MPHECTNCGRTFADGSKEMLSGCPDCSGTKFQFRPEGFDGDDGATASDDLDPARPGDGAVDRTDAATTDSEAADDLSGSRGDTVSRTVGSAAATVRDLVGGSASPDATTARPPDGDGASAEDVDDDIIVAQPDPGGEDAAQADARSGLATSEDVPEESTSDGADDGHSGSASLADPPTDAEPDGRSEVAEPDAETAKQPDISKLRKELNEQFESIRVVEPGQYELNLMELYDREEYIIALQEDGRYSIQVPEAWRDTED